MINRIKLFIGTGFYIGLLPKAPGTFGSLTALIPIYFLSGEHQVFYLSAIIIVASLLTFWVDGFFEENYEKDAAILVTDEWAGQALTFLGISLWGGHGITFAILVAGFLFFRLFDILKPLGISQAQDLPNGLGVLTDDLLAGFYAFLCLKTLIFVWPQIF